MNKKGMTLVELLITFSLLMIIIVGMFNLILDVKMDLDNKQIIKDLTEYSNFLNSDIHYDLITKRPFAIAIKQSNSTNWYLKYNNSYDIDNNCGGTEDNPEPCGIINNTLKVNVSKQEGNNEINISGSKNLTSICSDFYPCAVYAYYDESSLKNENGTLIPKYKVIAVNKDKKNHKYGVKYNNAFEELPNQKYINFKSTQVTMKIENEFFIIDYPIYMTGNSTNYGFKISYPFYDSFAKNINSQEP